MALDDGVPDTPGVWLDGDEGTTALPSDIDAISVVGGIDLAPGSPYVPEVQVTDDVVIRLAGDAAVRYALAVLAVAYRSQYVVGVFNQMSDVMRGRGRSASQHPPDEVAAMAKTVVYDLLKTLPELDEEATAPLLLQPVQHKLGQPMVRVSLPPHDEPLTSWTVAEATNHAHNVLAQVAVCPLDTAYRDLGAELGDQDDNRGRAMVHDLANYLPGASAGFEDPAHPAHPESVSRMMASMLTDPRMPVQRRPQPGLLPKKPKKKPKRRR